MRKMGYAVRLTTVAVTSPLWVLPVAGVLGFQSFREAKTPPTEEVRHPVMDRWLLGK